MAITKQDVKQRCIEKLNEGNRMFGSRGRLDQLTFVRGLSSNGRPTNGVAGYFTRDGQRVWYIKLSADLFESDPEYMMEEVVPHEVAHIVAHWLRVNKKRYGDGGHGSNWAHIAKALGATGNEDDSFKYKLPSGQELNLSREQHNLLHKEHRMLRTRDGERIAANMYVAP